MPVQSYRELFAWQKAMDFAAEVYGVTRRFPKEELYGVTAGQPFPFRATLPGAPSLSLRPLERQGGPELLAAVLGYSNNHPIEGFECNGDITPTTPLNQLSLKLR